MLRDRRGGRGDPGPNRVGVSQHSSAGQGKWACGRVCESRDQLATGLSE